MTEPGARPLLFLDVDGTLLPYGAASIPASSDAWTAWQSPGNPHLATMDRAHGPRLLALPCALVWATAWMHNANTVIAPLLGLPRLPVAGLPAPSDGEPPAGAPHWKLRTLVETAAGRPFVWADDEITDPDDAYVAAHHPGPALLLRADPAAGLTAADYARIERWLADSGRS